MRILPSGERAQRGEGIVAIETKVAREVVSGSEGDDDERDLSFDGDLGYPGQRAVAAGDSQRASAARASSAGSSSAARTCVVIPSRSASGEALTHPAVPCRSAD